MDFDNRKVYGDTSITDGLVALAPINKMKNMNQYCHHWKYLRNLQKKADVGSPCLANQMR